MPDITQLHRKAMDFADQAAAERRRGFYDRALELTRQAFELEGEAPPGKLRINSISNPLDRFFTVVQPLLPWSATRFAKPNV